MTAGRPRQMRTGITQKSHSNPAFTSFVKRAQWLPSGRPARSFSGALVWNREGVWGNFALELGR